jgi:hypothetical protein
MKATTLSIFVAIVALLAGISKASVIVHFANNSDMALPAVQLFYKSSAMQPLIEPLTAPLTTLKDSNVAGKIVLIPSLLFTSNFPLIREAQSRGAAGVLASLNFQFVPGYGQYTIDRQDVSYLAIPVVEMGLPESMALAQTMKSVQASNVTLLPDVESQNQWELTYSSRWMYVWQITVGISSLAIITWAIIKMVAFAKFYGRIILATVFVVLSIEMVSALRKMTPKQYIKSLRLIYCSVRIIFAVDPFQIHGLYSASMNLAFIDNSLPLVNISAILMILYWNEMMNTTSLEVNTFISKMRIPFIILSALIAAIHILRTILSQKLHIPAVDIFNASWSMFISTSVSVFYFIVGIKLLQRLKKVQRGNQVKRLKMITFRFLMCAVVLVLIVTLAVLFVALVPIYSPVC